MKPFLPWLAMCLPLLVAPARAEQAKPLRVILVGDSTMASNSGYGDALCRHFRPGVACINLARGGRSSGSYRSEGRWDEVKALLRDGAAYRASVVLVQFGHNDQPGKPGRSTDLVTEFPANMTRYVAEVSALSAQPVLVTPLTRRSFRGAYLHDDLAPWSAATRAVASAQHVPLLDLNALSARAVQGMGPEQADTLAQEPRPPEGAPKNKFDYTHLGPKGATLFAAIVAGELKRLAPVLAPAIASEAVTVTDPARLAAPSDGWANQQSGTRGGAAATDLHVFTVASRAELQRAIASGGDAPKIIKVSGAIDMSEGRPFASSKDQGERSVVKLGSNTTLIGIGASAGFINASIQLNDVSQVIIRNLAFRNPCDVGPVWDPNDGSKGNWNSLFDSITVSGSTFVWIDHNSFTDAPLTDNLSPIENGMRKQCHDGALDITRGSDMITVSYNHFALHEKNTLIGSGDKAAGDEGRLSVTLSNNLFENVAERSPRVRFGKVHVFNNLYIGDRAHPAYAYGYGIGVGKQARIVSQNNVFDIAGARGCKDAVKSPDGGLTDRAFRDSGSTLNGQPLTACPVDADPGWSAPYPYTLRATADVRAHVLANAGAGKIDPASVRVQAMSPAPGAVVPADTPLRLVFDRTPVLGAQGAVRIFRQSDNEPVDIIGLGDETTAIGMRGMDQLRYVKQPLIKVNANSIVIKPHSGALACDTIYYVTVDDGLLPQYRGIGKAAGWTFRTGPAPKAAQLLTVDDDGMADFRTVQGALNFAMTAYPRNAPLTIDIRDGIYDELLFLRGRDNLTMRGQSRDGAVIQGLNNETLNGGSGQSQAALNPDTRGGRALLLIEDSDLLTLETLTLKNTSLRSAKGSGQAETLVFSTDTGRLVARNAAFYSEQDTVQLRGYAWFYRTLVAGNVDFIWGNNRAALFEESEIRSVGDTANPASGGYIVQARTVSAGEHGFVFLNSTLTHGAGPGPQAGDVPAGSTWLARSPGRPITWDNVSFINCKMDSHVAPAGWAGNGVKLQPLPNPAAPDANSGWREFGSMDLAGKPLDLSQRAGGYVMKAEEVAARFANRTLIFAARGWDPKP